VELAKPYEHTACSAEMEIGPIDIVKRALKFYASRSIWGPLLCRKIF
jgi:hypothetical protein